MTQLLRAIAASSRGGGLKRVCASSTRQQRVYARLQRANSAFTRVFNAQWAAVSKPHPEEAAKPPSRRMERRRGGQMESCSRGEGCKGAARGGQRALSPIWRSKATARESCEEQCCEMRRALLRFHR